ncbi:MAG: T9SS type A sorting domain-containing protein [Ignavibacteria bacterium]|nr:T9SS type A sorting domain-containing protein [Ignavibacteria bacterium]
MSIGLETAGHGQSTYCMIPMERCASALKWDTATYVDENNVLSSYTLGDYISTGDALQIKIPDTNPIKYFWLSNNQKVSKYDGVSRGSNTCWKTNKYQQDPYCGEGKGLFIFLESATNCSNNINGYDPSNGDVYFPFDLMNAEGKFDWALDRIVTDPFLGTFGIQKVTNGDRVNGVSEFNKLYLRAYPNWSGQLITDDPCSSDTSDYFITGDFHGDGLDSYNINYDEIFSPYSNPATNSCQNPSTNSGLTIALQSQDSATGAITVKVYFDDATAITDLPPSKPKNISVTKNYTSGTGNPFNPKITWDGNIEPDFYNASPSTYGIASVYEIYRGSSTDCGAVPEYSFLNSVASTVTEYIDYSTTLYDPSPGATYNCYTNKTTYSYKILAKDNRGYRSLKSERGLVAGFANACWEAEGPDNLILTNDIPKEFNLYNNYPNPFNPSTSIRFDIPSDNFVDIKVYNVLGMEVVTLVNEFRKAGSYIVSFNGSNLSSGVYYFKIKSGEFEEVRKMLLIK